MAYLITSMGYLFLISANVLESDQNYCEHIMDYENNLFWTIFHVFIISTPLIRLKPMDIHRLSKVYS